MTDSIDWGSIKYSDFQYARYPVDRDGCRLFIIKNQKAEFPETDYTVLPMIHGLSAIGYLNFNPIDYQVTFDESRLLTSNDGHKFRAIIDIQIELSDNLHDTWREVIKRGNGLEGTMRAAILKSAASLFTLYDYISIRANSAAIASELQMSLSTSIFADMPYKIIRAGYSSEAVDTAVEAGIIDAIRAKSQDKNDAEHRRLEGEAAGRDRAIGIEKRADDFKIAAEQADNDRAELAKAEKFDGPRQDAAHVKMLERKKAENDAEIETEKNRANARIESEKRELDAKVEAFKRISEIAGDDPVKMLLATNPESAAKVLLAQMQGQNRIELATISANERTVAAENQMIGIQRLLGPLPNTMTQLNGVASPNPTEPDETEDTDAQ